MPGESLVRDVARVVDGLPDDAHTSMHVNDVQQHHEQSAEHVPEDVESHEGLIAAKCREACSHNKVAVAELELLAGPLAHPSQAPA